MIYANLMALSFIEPELYHSEKLHDICKPYGSIFYRTRVIRSEFAGIWIFALLLPVTSDTQT